ncbi:MAG: hypothetical protein ACRYFU_00980 [Janthinobacterium lividum]
MPASLHRWRDDVPGIVAYLAVTSVVVLYFAHRVEMHIAAFPAFWDARVYLHALEDWRGGIDPYVAGAPSRTGARLPFVSPPIFLYLMAFLSRIFPGRFGVLCYWSLSFVATLALPALLAKFYLRSRWMIAALCLFLFCFQPEKHGSQALLTGNLSNVLYALVLAAGVPGLKRNNWRLFYVVMVFAGLMKPPFLAFLLLPLLAGRKQWPQCAGTVLAVLAGDLGQWFSMPKYWHEFQQNVFVRVFVHGDAGFGLLAQCGLFGGSIPLVRRLRPSMDVALVIVPLFLLLFFLRNRRFGQTAERLWVPCLVLLGVLSNPRILDYDAGVAVLPAVYIAVEFCRSLPAGRWRGLQVGLPLVFLVGMVATKPNTALCLLLVLSVVLVVVLLLWPAYFVGVTEDMRDRSAAELLT